MINTILAIINAFTRALEAAAAAEQRKTEAKLLRASALVTQAGAHRRAAQFARKVSSGLRDIQE